VRAAICHGYGPPESLVIGELPSRPLETGEIRIGVRAASVNFPDNLIIQGKYQVKPPLPFAPGFEVAGIIIEAGASVTDFHIGDRVMALTKGGHGGFAQDAIADDVATEHIPSGMDFVTATAFYSSYATSYHALVQRGRLAPGETLLVLGAAGGIGLAAIEIGKSLGARVIAAAGSPEKLDVARKHGADELIDYRSMDLRDQILSLTGGRGVDVCFDGVGGDAFDAVARAMNRKGRLLVLGFASGRIPKVPVNLLLLKGYEVVGVYWNNFVLAEPATKRENARKITAMYKRGEIRPLISATFQLTEVSEALRAVDRRDVIGKLVITLDSAN
jgi:NADPH:quinone reductase